MKTLQALSSFGNNHSYIKFEQKEPKELSSGRKFVVGACTAAGVVTSLAILSKNSGYSFSKMFKTPIKDTYLMKQDYHAKEIIPIATGSVLGGFVGGMLVDKKENWNAKFREGVVQLLGNISIPIMCVELFSIAGKAISSKFKMPQINGAAKWVTPVNNLLNGLPQVVASLGGLAVGIPLGNKTANLLNEKVFNKKDNREIIIEDFSAHLDDLCVAASYISEDNWITKGVGRIVPIALMVAGNSVGQMQER